MTRSSLVARRVALPVTAALVGGTFAAIGVASPAHAGGSQNVDKSFDYICQVNVGGLDLVDQKVGVQTVAKVPATVYRGERISPTPVAITLTLPEDLRYASYDILSAREADGKSTDSAVTLASAGRSLTQAFTIAAGKTAIPSTVGASWTIPAKGTVPAITTPNYTSGTATLSMPKKFSITASIYPAAPAKPIPSKLVCATSDALTLATIRQVNAAPKAPRAIKVVTKKNKAKKFVIRATDADGNRLVYKAGKVKKKAGKVVVKGKRLTFKPRKNFKGKTSVIISIRDGKGGITRTKVNITVRK